MAKRNIIVIGASAGGLSPLKAILARLPAELDATLFIVQHLGSQSPSYLPEILSASSPLPAQWALDRDSIRPGTVYVAPPDRHLLLNHDEMRVRFGPREAFARPSIDVLFRSAAAAFGSQVIGVILSGKLDDGTRGLHAVKRCGGLTLIMNPDLAEEPEMPKNALRETEADYVLAPEAIGDVISQLSEETAPSVVIPQDIRWENQMAQGAMISIDAPEPEEGRALSCPECGGSLQRIEDETGGSGYRCYLGHAYGSSSLLKTQQDQLEQALWMAMRILADRKRVLVQLARDYETKNQPHFAAPLFKRISELDRESEVLRTVLVSLHTSESPTDGNSP